MEFDDQLDPWGHLVLPAAVRDALLRVWRTIRAAASQETVAFRGSNILIFGDPGTGKSEITKVFSGIDGIRFFRVWAMDFKGQYVGQSQKCTQEVFSKARSAAPSILSIDMEQGPYSDDCLFAPRASNRDSYGDEILLETLIQLDRLQAKPCPVFVIAETFDIDRVDPAIASRFDTKIEIPLPGESERREILKRAIQGFPTDPDLDIEEVSAVLARWSLGRSGRDLQGLVRRAIRNALDSATDPNTARLDRRLLLDEVPTAVIDLCEQLGLSQGVRDDLESLSMLLHSARWLRRRGFSLPRVLLSASAGIDKAQIARALATAGNVPLVEARACDLKAELSGQSSERIQNLFDRARAQAPCVVFIDEIESIAVERGSPNWYDNTNEIVSALIAQLRAPGADDLVVLASTIHPENLHSSVQLRMSKKIHIAKLTRMAKIEITQGDITQQAVDAIVNAANSSLLGGGGVDGAIHHAAGRQLFEECRTLGGSATGDAKITKGYRLPAKFVIHTVGPIYGGGSEDAELLANCYRNSLRLANEHQLKTVAFPSISTGAFGYPLYEACRIALRSTKEALASGSTTVERVVFVTFSYTDYRAYEQAYKEIFESMNL